MNAVAREPKTVAQLAAELRLSQPTVHAHVVELVASELLCESEGSEKRYATERYYEPNFPVVRAEERAEFDLVCDAVAQRVAELFEEHLPELKRAFERTELAGRGAAFEDVSQYCYAGAQRAARRKLEERGLLPKRKEHANGAAWIFWAEEGRPT